MILKLRQLFNSILLLDIMIPIVIGLLLGIAVLRFSPFAAIAALAAALLMIALLKKPELILIGLLVGTSTILGEESMLRVSIGVGRLYLTDLVIIAFLSFIIIRLLFDRKFKTRRTPLDLPLLIFYCIALLSSFISVRQGVVTFNESLGELRTINSYLLFFVVTYLFQEDRHIALLLRGISLLAIIVATVMIAQYWLGSSVHILAGRVEMLETSGKDYKGITRILPPGEPLIILVFIITTASLVVEKFKFSRILDFLKWGLLGVALAFTFRRSVWMALVIALLIMNILLQRQERLKYFGWVMVVLVLGITTILLIFSEPHSKMAKLTNAFFERIETIADARSYETNSVSTLRWRDFEYKYALPQIASHPILGLGLGAMYRPYLHDIDYEQFDGRRFTHNGHLYIILKTGLLGYLVFLSISILVLWRGFKYWRCLPDPGMRSIVLGITLAFLGAFLSAISEPRFMDWNWTPVLGIMIGVNEVIFRRYLMNNPTSLTQNVKSDS
jgi:O-antigen ligase